MLHPPPAVELKLWTSHFCAPLPKKSACMASSGRQRHQQAAAEQAIYCAQLQPAACCPLPQSLNRTPLPARCYAPSTCRCHPLWHPDGSPPAAPRAGLAGGGSQKSSPHLGCLQQSAAMPPLSATATTGPCQEGQQQVTVAEGAGLKHAGGYCRHMRQPALPQRNQPTWKAARSSARLAPVQYASAYTSCWNQQRRMLCSRAPSCSQQRR